MRIVNFLSIEQRQLARGQNVNFPGRDKCNRRTCGKPRVDIGGGGPVHLEPAPYKPMPYAPPEPRAPPPGDYPEGSAAAAEAE